MIYCLRRLLPVILAALSTFAWSQLPTDVADLVGARGSSGETQMQARGYQLIRATRVQDQSWTFWWNEVQSQCVSIATSDGRYASINLVPSQNCNAGGQTSPDKRPVPQLGEQSLTLVCYGEGSRPSVAAHNGYQWDHSSKHYEPTFGVESTTDHFRSEVQIDIRGSAGRIRPADKLVPPIHSGDRDGWWDLTDLDVSADQISGRYRLSGFNSPKLSIDRRSGLIEITGLSQFSGKCDAGDWGAARRF